MKSRFLKFYRIDHLTKNMPVMQLELPTAHLNNRFSSEDGIQVIIQYKTNSKVKARHQQKRLQKLPIQHAFSLHEKQKKKRHTQTKHNFHLCISFAVMWWKTEQLFHLAAEIIQRKDFRSTNRILLQPPVTSPWAPGKVSPGKCAKKNQCFYKYEIYHTWIQFPTSQTAGWSCVSGFSGVTSLAPEGRKLFLLHFPAAREEDKKNVSNHTHTHTRMCEWGNVNFHPI